MSERYESLFSLPEKLYTRGSPVLICAGRILKDRQTGRKLAQLKYKSICDKTIVSLSVRLSSSDAAGRPVGEPVTYTYSDLNVKRDEEFGQKTPIVLNDRETCGFDVCVTEVIFGDRSVWDPSDEAKWEPLVPVKKLSEAFDDKELVKQYRIRFGEKCDRFPIADRDLRICACGALDRAEELFCHRCGADQTALFSLDMDSLKKDRDERIENEKRQQEAERLERERKDKIAAKKRKRIISIATPIVVFCFIFLIVLITVVIIPKQKLDQAMGLLELGDYEAGYALLEEIGKSDEIASNKYDRAMALIDSGDFEAAYAFLEELGNTDAIVSNKIDRAISFIHSGDYKAGYALLEEIGNSDAIALKKYKKAISLIDSGDREAAYVLLDGLDYQDSEYRRRSIQGSDDFITICPVGGTFFFGSYEQDNNISNGKEDIEWLVLAKEDGKALVISRYALDCQRFNTTCTPVTWETCSLRKWLNGTFINDAFSADEQNLILSTTVTADDPPLTSASPGNNTTDKVFLLNITEVDKYFRSRDMMQCLPTPYAVAQGAYQSKGETVDGKLTCYWWLRSAYDSIYVATIETDGTILGDQDYVDSEDGSVRPAFWVDLTS